VSKKKKNPIIMFRFIIFIHLGKQPVLLILFLGCSRMTRRNGEKVSLPVDQSFVLVFYLFIFFPLFVHFSHAISQELSSIAKMLMMHITYWFKRERVTNNDGVPVRTLHGRWRGGNMANHLKIWGGKPQEKKKQLN